MNDPDQHNCPSFDEILSALDDPVKFDKVIKRLELCTPETPELKGVKSFIEDHGTDREALKGYLFSNVIEIESKKDKRAWWKLAAVIVILIGIGTVFYIGNNDDTEEQNEYAELYDQYYEKDHGMPVVLSENTNKAFNDAMNLYRAEEYDQALAGFSSLLENSPDNDTLQYYIAVSCMELEDLNCALTHFIGVRDVKYLREKAQYRIALIYVKQQEKDKARSVLTSIAGMRAHVYHQQASELLSYPALKK